MQHKHFNIPIFIPHAACPHRCIFCNQKRISGTESQPLLEEIELKIEKYLSTIPGEGRIEIAFFGGSFTGLPIVEQEKYLQTAYKFIKQKLVHGIRLSTRPDYINKKVLSLLKRYGTTAIELGIQSMDREVLELSKRGHSVRDIINACNLIKEAGIQLGLQMMIGLPGDIFEKSINTAHAIADLGATFARVYPALVIRGTELENLYMANKYKPLSLEQAVIWCTEILLIFEKAGINVIRMGLHPSAELLSGESLVAGPFHTSFRELVLTEIWRKLLERFLKVSETQKLVLYINPEEFNYAVGYKASNKKMLLRKFKKVIYKREPYIQARYYGAEYY